MKVGTRCRIAAGESIMTVGGVDVSDVMGQGKRSMVEVVTIGGDHAGLSVRWYDEHGRVLESRAVSVPLSVLLPLPAMPPMPGDQVAGRHAKKEKDGELELAPTPAPRAATPTPNAGGAIGAIGELIATAARDAVEAASGDLEERLAAHANSVVAESISEALAKFDGGISPDQVRAIVEEALGARIARIEVKAPNGDIKHADGLADWSVPFLRELGYGHDVALVGPSGCGKTHTARACATLLSAREFGCISFASDVPLSWLVGRVDAHGVYHPSALVRIVKDGGLFLLDEFDGADANTLLVLNTLLGDARGFLTLPTGEVIERHAECRIALGLNTFGTGATRVFAGRNQLDAATLSRFVVVVADYDRNVEKVLSGNASWLPRFHAMRENITRHGLRRTWGTRELGRIVRRTSAGETWEAARDRELASWADAIERAKVTE